MSDQLKSCINSALKVDWQTAVSLPVSLHKGPRPRHSEIFSQQQASLTVLKSVILLFTPVISSLVSGCKGLEIDKQAYCFSTFCTAGSEYWIG